MFSLYSSGGTNFYKSIYVYASFILALVFGYLVIFSVPKDKSSFMRIGIFCQTIKCGVKAIFWDILQNYTTKSWGLILQGADISWSKCAREHADMKCSANVI